MATKYISWDTGDDGTGDGSLATPWKSFSKALTGGAPALADGDILIVAPGIYRETLTITLAPTGETIIRGDPQNTSGFAGVNPGIVMLSGYTTDDATAWAAAVNVTAASKDYFTWEDIWIHGRGGCITLTTCENWTFRRCHIFNYMTDNAITTTPAINIANGLTVDSCVICSNAGRGILISSCPTSDAADYDLSILIKNTVIRVCGLNPTVEATATGAGAFFAGGIDVLNCTLIGRYGVYLVTAAKFSTTIPCTCYNSVIFGVIGLLTGTAPPPDQLVEDYNLILCGTTRSNVSAGANSQTTARAPYLDFGQSQLWGLLPKMPFSPWPQSRTLGFGGSSPPTTDLLGRPRPSGAGPILASAATGIGALDCHNYGVKETTVKDAGDASIKLTGPGDHEIRIPVDASATTISIKARFDSATYGGANYPQAILLDATEIGVTTETETATIAASDAWETLTFTQFTPTAKGWVTIRLVNRGSGGDDICYFDTITVT